MAPTHPRQQGLSTHRKRSRQPCKKDRVTSTLYNLTLDIHDLRHQIQQLALQRARILSRTVSPDGASCLKIERLFGVFNYGYQVRDSVPCAYVEMLTGGAMLFEAWRRHADVFAVTRCDVQAVRVEPTVVPEEDEDFQDDMAVVCIVHVDNISRGTFTTTGIRVGWPAVLHDPQLTQALVGLEMVKPMRFRFAFNRAGRVVWYTIESDYEAALTLALGGDAVRAQRALDPRSPKPRIEAVLDRDERGESSTITTETRAPADDNRLERDLVDVDGDTEAKLTTDARHGIAFLLS